MGFAEDELEEYIRKNPEKFQYINVEELLPFLTCLTQVDQERLRADLNNKGNQLTIWNLFNYLRCRNKWPDTLIKALRKFEYPVADELQRKYDFLVGRPHQNNTPVTQSAAVTPLPAVVTVISVMAAEMDTHHSQKKSVSPPAVLPSVQSHLQSFPVVNSASPAVQDNLSFSSSDTESCSYQNNEHLDDHKIPIQETQQSASEVLRTNITPKARKANSEHPQQNSSSAAAEEPVKDNKARQKIGAVVDAPVISRVTSKVSAEERSMNISKPGVLISRLDEEEPYSLNSDSLQLSLSTAESTPGGENSVSTFRNDPLLISNSTASSLLDVRVPRERDPEENHYAYDSSSQLLSRRNRNAIPDRRDMKDSVRVETRYKASGDAVDRHNESHPNDGIGNKTNSDDISLQPEREKTSDPVENSLDSTEINYHELYFAEDSDVDLKMANDRVAVFKDSVSTSSDTPRKKNVPGESSDRTPMLPNILLFTSILVFSSVSIVLLWKYRRN
uniref:Mitochondrial antiviral-signaling protein n=1 Tax=Geotrypetes seraphini TaxID=260995 RepID=A0A6P8RT56_GEOSA|nr:mitochondrial antiviral-signaling protein [Geotrypetes seraphini]XP_033808768.1 mitochondrial antiviral-signaling protein [Geotrypetes seraphini]